MVDCLFSVDGTNFTYDDTHAGFGVVYYRITQVNYDGRTHQHDPQHFIKCIQSNIHFSCSRIRNDFT